MISIFIYFLLLFIFLITTFLIYFCILKFKLI
uniref:Cytochrome b6-f complex subunit 6 n=1 Tax=Codium arabicum TaxID=221038 RepID=A0A386B0P6_CODAR|nr:cytochrome b6-f complex subunit 6 [Codium arabicum]AYC65265.1 cytochrome b6-f complex subunit 6 [Codium arabicum]